MHNSLIQKIETLLFVLGDEGIKLRDLASVLEIHPETIKQAIDELEQKYQNNVNSALTILQTGDRYTLTTKKEMADLIKQYITNPLSNTISQAALETLSIIAYKQPISRSQVDEIRGVNSHGAIQRLVQARLVEKKGRMDVPGRPILYGTSEYFLDYFGLRSMEDLPDITQMEEEMNKEIPQDLFFERFADKKLLIDEEKTENED
ncbi:MAG: SMC-Scp complex subunit ScpB [Streptococcaceae bacterium]|jgi:segregation and condensation protein B|nr:SMC-Scp complex subunit ScpB [Streptococcaceae bacterium]